MFSSGLRVKLESRFSEDSSLSRLVIKHLDKAEYFCVGAPESVKTIAEWLDRSLIVSMRSSHCKGVPLYK